MPRRHQRRHYRRSKYGRLFKAGKKYLTRNNAQKFWNFSQQVGKGAYQTGRIGYHLSKKGYGKYKDWDSRRKTRNVFKQTGIDVV